MKFKYNLKLYLCQLNYVLFGENIKYKIYNMVSYKDLGLVNTLEMFARAIEGGYAIPAFNFNNMEQMQAIISACVETKSPVILRFERCTQIREPDTPSLYGTGGCLSTQKNWAAPFPCTPSGPRRFF
jgi:hypothetical protein